MGGDIRRNSHMGLHWWRFNDAAVDQRRCCHRARNAKHSKGRWIAAASWTQRSPNAGRAPGIGTSVCKPIDQGPAQPNFGPRLLSQKPEMREFQELSSEEPRCDADCYRRPPWTRAFTRHVGCFFRYLACVSGSRPLDLLLADGGSRRYRGETQPKEGKRLAQ